MRIVVFLVLALTVLTMAQERAADLYVGLSEDCVAQLKAQKITYVIPRCYTNIGMIDRRCPESLETASEVGLKADLYIYPCPNCGNPVQQVTETINNVGNRKVGRYWVFAENFQWKQDKNYNREFLRGMINELVRRGKQPGIYSNEYLWDILFGLDWREMGAYPLWYKNNDGSLACRPFKPFGGWTAPVLKQYGVSDMCGACYLDVAC